MQLPTPFRRLAIATPPMMSLEDRIPPVRPRRTVHLHPLPAGYCLTIFVPVSIACVVPIDWLRWTLVMVATAISAGFLFMNFRATIYSAAPAK